MNLDEKFSRIRNAFYEFVSSFFIKLAKLFGYPSSQGMPTIPDSSTTEYFKVDFYENLPLHKTFWPPLDRPESWFELIFGVTPKTETIPKYVYESKEEGFYNFYIENYRNIYFLPDWLSEFIQVKLHVCLDLNILEIVREVVFLALIVYSQIITVRIFLSWFISINPYTIPWAYLVAMVDWTEDFLQGATPMVFGVNLIGTLLLSLIGAIADSLNHLVFTMPFLPSEGEKAKLLINNKVTDVLIFHYLPILWYRHPIPNEIREFWYNSRPEILKYMQKAYAEFDIQFLPDQIIN